VQDSYSSSFVTGAFRVYFGIWLTVKLNFGQRRLSQADSSQGRNVSFNQREEDTKGKVTEHEVTGGEEQRYTKEKTGRPLTFPAGDQ